MCQRALGRTVGESGEVRLGPLPTGAFRVAFEDGPAETHAVEVTSGEAHLDLR